MVVFFSYINYILQNNNFNIIYRLQATFFDLACYNLDTLIDHY